MAVIQFLDQAAQEGGQQGIVGPDFLGIPVKIGGNRKRVAGDGAAVPRALTLGDAG